MSYNISLINHGGSVSARGRKSLVSRPGRGGSVEVARVLAGMEAFALNWGMEHPPADSCEERLQL